MRTNMFNDKGRIFEQLVFLYLRQKTKEITYFKDIVSECDFIIRGRDQPIAAIQLSYSIQDEETRRHEINGIMKAAKALGLKEGTIVTYDDRQATCVEDGFKIKSIPLLNYLL